MERPNTVSGLLAKRAEFAGQIKHLQAKLSQLLADQDAIDCTIRLFDCVSTCNFDPLTGWIGVQN